MNQPHRSKLISTLKNKSLLLSDRKRVEEALERYDNWLDCLKNINSHGVDLLRKMVTLLNEYKRFIEIDLIFDSENDFLYRQKGQLKIDNTILEEFLPFLIDPRLITGLSVFGDITIGPQKSYSGLSFTFVHQSLHSGSVEFKFKDQDFIVGKRYFTKISTSRSFEPISTIDTDINVAYFAAEIKTNLDKTMFQEASATAKELKQSVSGAKYVVICEWLDMSPISTKVTEIDEILILRKGKRLPSNIRDNFSTHSGRKNHRDRYIEYLDSHPLSVDVFTRILKHLNEVFPETTEIDESDVLSKGFF